MCGVVSEGLRVAATSAARGWTEHRCAKSEPKKGILMVLQFGLKSVAMVQVKSFSIESLKSGQCEPIEYGVPVKNPVLTPADSILILES